MRWRWPADRVTPSGSDHRVIAIGQADDQLVRPGLLCRGNHFIRLEGRRQSRDILGHSSLEQLHFLRKIAEMAAERVGRPLADLGAVEANAALRRRPHPDQRPRQ